MLKWRPPTDLLAAASSAHSSCMASPSLDSVSESEETDVGYFGRSLHASPESTGYVSEDESVAAESDTTLEEAAEFFADFGHPLERMPRSEGRIGELDLDSAGRFGHGTIYHPGETCSSWCPSPAQSVSSVTSSITDYHAVIDNLLSMPNSPFDDLDPQNFVTFDPDPITPLSLLPPKPSLMIKRISRESPELSVIFDLNSADLRQDPWNPCPHVLQTVDHDPASKYLYLCMERLNEFNAPPMSTVAQYIDFLRQILEGLSFLHEHKLAGLSCSDPNSFMVDLSSGLHSNNGSFSSLLACATTSRGQARDLPATQKHSRSRDRPHHHPQHRYQHQHQHRHRHLVQPVDVAAFDRSIYPVRYYFVNFTYTRRIQRGDPARDRTLSVPLPPPSKRTCPFKQDVKELGTLIERILVDLPSVVCTKFRALIKAMTVGGFGAEDSRKLFEALTQSLDAGAFELAVRRGSGLRSRSFVTSDTGAMSGSTYAPSSIRGDFGLEPDTVALSS